MFDRPQSGERALLVYVHAPGEFSQAAYDEFEQLALSSGAEIVERVSAARRQPDPRFYLGRGKVDELAEFAEDQGAELTLFNAPLTPAQERNLERRLKCRVLDRVGLILDLFAQRASTFEGKLQVELAQLRHLSTRVVRGWTHLERQKGGIGLRGPGEKQLETDRRLIAERIRRIGVRLEAVERRRALGRRARKQAGIPVVSLVGYTNAGKSTLFNALTGAGVLVEDRLFATLDPTLRQVTGPGGTDFLLADTVGFISDLPHDLVAAFRATLEETANATLLLHVIDASDAEWRFKVEQVNLVLESIGASAVPQIEVFNKVDCLPDGDLGLPSAVAAEGQPERARVSAVTGVGLIDLARAVERYVAGASVALRFRIPFADGGLRAALFDEATVVRDDPCTDRGWEMDVHASSAAVERLRRRYPLDDFLLEPGLVITEAS